MTETSIPDNCGFVFAATGETYITLARRAARSLRQIHPDAEIDLFTDVALDDPIFSQVHILSDSFFRPKMEAMAKSRFERTVCLDADLMVVAPLTALFEVLDQFDMAACHDRIQTNSWSLMTYSRPVPGAFAASNSGVVALRRNETTQTFLTDWQEAVKSSQAKKDQPAFRELLYYGDIRLCTLPPSYNVMQFHELKTWWGIYGAPKVLHSQFLHLRRGGPGNPEAPFTMEELVGRLNALRVRRLLEADVTVTPDLPISARRLNNPLQPAIVLWARRKVAPAYHWLREGRWR